MRGPWLLLVLALAAGAALAKERLPRLLGGLQAAEENDAGVQRALRFAMSEYNKASNDVYRSAVAEVLQARKQIVSGVKYYLDVKVGRTTCTKSAKEDESCVFHETPALAQRVTCNFVVYVILGETKLASRKINASKFLFVPAHVGNPWP
ncbi:LOW QUALITY PROTEIN: cystatin-C [Pelodiscus sinensis]|uniref:LOW QUALITY PROTEIN: cystatin-C n=1 Tax=Pelodiscus sinensis TaxID=13735 RepID=UPI003F6C9688